MEHDEQFARSGKPAPRKRALRRSVSRGQALAWAQAAERNATDHRVAADVLASAGHHCKAAGLAILGCEEASKSWLLYLWTLGFIKKPDIFDVLQRDHRKKHALAHMVAAIAPLIDQLERLLPEAMPLSPGLSVEITSPAHAAELGAGLLRKLLPVLQDECFWGPPVRAITASWAEAVEDGALDSMKQRAFYADPPPEDPSQSGLPAPGETEYRSMITTLDKTLSILRLFSECLHDESCLAQFDSVRAGWPVDWIQQTGGDPPRDVQGQADAALRPPGLGT